MVIAGATIADFGTIILLSLFFSREARGLGTQLVLIGGLALLGLAVLLAIRRAERSARLSMVLGRLQDTTAQIRVRGTFALLAAFVALAQWLGFEVILGAFLAGAVLKLVDRDALVMHPRFRQKLEAIGFGVFIPVFFVASGLRFNLAALFESGAALAQVPIFVLALLVVRGLPALLYRPLVGGRQTAAAVFLQATSLGFIVVAAQIGLELGLISEATGAALVTAGLVSVLIFPLVALSILRGAKQAAGPLPAEALPSGQAARAFAPVER